MSRLTIIVEGQTEESFVAGPLYQSLFPAGIFAQPILLGRAGHRGGHVSYQRVRSDLIRSMKQDPTAYCSTLFDLYGLGSGFSQLIKPSSISGQSKADDIETALKLDICSSIEGNDIERRFIPYVQVHEFEGLLFSDPEQLAAAMYRPAAATQLWSIRNAFSTPEDIDDGPETAPSKRIQKLHIGYDKVVSGTLAAEAIGIATIRQHCPRFNAWFEKLLGCL